MTRALLIPAALLVLAGSASAQTPDHTKLYGISCENFDPSRSRHHGVVVSFNDDNSTEIYVPAGPPTGVRLPKTSPMRFKSKLPLTITAEANDDDTVGILDARRG